MHCCGFGRYYRTQKAEERLKNECAAYFENDEKQQRAAELSPNTEHFSKRTKEKRAAELINANNELIFQNEEKVKRAAELMLPKKSRALPRNGR
jgi:hypothetical protein